MSSEILKYLYYVDGKLYWKIKPCRNIAINSLAGNRRKDGYVSIRFKGKAYLAHRLIWEMFTGEKPDIIDHIDGDKGNNKISNLRNCTQADNRANQHKVNASSGFKGVYWANGVWCARIKSKGKQRTLGYSKDPIVCAKLYDEAARHLFRQFARTNFKDTK